jgi:hypothetical protein
MVDIGTNKGYAQTVERRPLMNIVGNKREGDLYQATKDVSLKEVTQRIRTEARQLVAEWNKVNGEALGKVKVSVRMPHYGAIDARLEVNGLLYALYREYGEYAFANRLTDRIEHIQSGDAKFLPLVKLYELRNAIEEIRSKYNYNNSDAQVDYFEVRYYGGTDIRNAQGGY